MKTTEVCTSNDLTHMHIVNYHEKKMNDIKQYVYLEKK